MKARGAANYKLHKDTLRREESSRVSLGFELEVWAEQYWECADLWSVEFLPHTKEIEPV